MGIPPESVDTADVISSDTVATGVSDTAGTGAGPVITLCTGGAVGANVAVFMEQVHYRRID